MNIVQFINKDVIEENENKKVMVALRVLYLIVFVAFLLDMVIAGGDAIRESLVGFIISLVCLIGLFIYTYHSRTAVSLRLFVVFILVWTVYMIPRMGWSAGMQNYFILVLLMVFFGSLSRLRIKLIWSAVILLARIVLISTLAGVPSTTTIDMLHNRMLQIVNISAVFISIIYLAYTFSKEEKEAEGKLVKYNDMLKKEANTDQLTGLFNRRWAMDFLEELVDDESHNSVSVAMGDIDFFKKVNDNYGHDAGDEVLKAIAGIMTSTLRNNTFVSRWGGEEFLIILPDTNGDEARIALERLRQTIEETVIKVDQAEIRVTITFGLTEYDYSGDFESTIKEADEKLYTGKEAGRNRVVY